MDYAPCLQFSNLLPQYASYESAPAAKELRNGKCREGAYGSPCGAEDFVRSRDLSAKVGFGDATTQTDALDLGVDSPRALRSTLKLAFKPLH